MTIRQTCTFICDLCGTTIDTDTVHLQNNPGLAPPVPRNAHQSRVAFGGFVLDLCGDCQQPLRDAFEARKLHLRSLGKLTGYPA